MGDVLAVGVGDVLAVQTTGWAAKVIRWGERLAGKPGLDNHVVIVHHITDGVWWGVEGRPGGVGWACIDGYLRNGNTRSNALQPRTPAQRTQIAALAEQMLGTPYDWEGIGADAAHDLGLPILFTRDWNGQGAPGQVVCSSFAAYVYTRLGLPAPKGGRLCQPDDWAVWDNTEGWNR